MSVHEPASRQIRLLRTFLELQSGFGKTMEELTSQFRVTRRTIFRDFATLRQAGIEVIHDDELGCYRLIRQDRFQHVNHLEDTDFNNLLLAAHLSFARVIPEFSASLRQTTLKLLGCCSDKVRHDYTRLSDVCVVQGDLVSHTARLHGTIRLALESARLRRRLCVVLEPELANSPVKLEQLEISPYRIMITRAGWQMLGLVHPGKQIRMINLASVQSSQLSLKTYALPQDFRYQMGS